MAGASAAAGELGGGLGDDDSWGLGAAASGEVAPDVAMLGVGVLGVLALGVPLTEAVGVAVLDPPGGIEGGVVGVEPEQADTDTVASIARAAQPTTVPRKRRWP